MTDISSCPLTVVQPFPPARPVPEAYERHRPERSEQRVALIDLTSGLDPASWSWGRLIDELLALGRTDIPLARLAEGHIDAVRILSQGGRRPYPGALYGVWASRSERTGLSAEPRGSAIKLSGTLRFASGAGLIDRVLVPVWPPDGRHLLLDLEVAGLPVDESRWRSAAMAASRTHELAVDGLLVGATDQVGPPEFYLDRPDFFPGGVGVAACWVGGAARVADLLHARHPHPNPAQQLRLGRVRTDLVVAAAVIRSAAGVLDDPPVDLDRQLLATEARAGAAEAVRRILSEARLIAGPAGMALDDGIAHAVPDLELYALQQNGDGDAVLLGDPERAS